MIPTDAPPLELGSAARLFASLHIERTATGAVRIEASPDTAEALAALFEGFARALMRG